MNKRGLTPIAIAFLGVALWLVLSPLGANDVVGGDEGYYGVMARNILADPHYILSVSNTPLGLPGDKPPIYPLILASSIGLLGPTETALRLPSIVMAFLIVVFTSILVARVVGPAWAAVTAAFLVTLPWFADASRSGWGEIPTTMFCLAGVVLATSRHFNTWRAVGAGALFGLGFLCKLWFAALFIIPLLIVFLFGSPDRKRFALFVIGSAVVVGSLQLIGIAIVSPHEFGHWWGIYFGTSLVNRFGGEGFAGYWVESPWYYWFKMSKAFVLMLPLIAFGIEACIRNLKNQFLLMFLMWGTMILVLSLFQVKSGIYLYPFVPPLVALAAIGAASLFRRTAHVGYLSALFFILTSPLLASLLGEPSPALLPWATVWIVALISILIRSRSTEWPRLATTIMVVLVIAGGSIEQLNACLCAITILGTARLSPRSDPDWRIFRRIESHTLLPKNRHLLTTCSEMVTTGAPRYLHGQLRGGS